MGEVLQFPQRRTCFRCTRYVENYCQLYDELIDSELFAAQDCPGYEVDDET